MAVDGAREAERKVGIALIICNEYFSCGQKKRRGAQADLKILTDTFKQLQFDVRSFSNLTSTDTLREAKAG